jgi:hypothetical protein
LSGTALKADGQMAKRSKRLLPMAILAYSSLFVLISPAALVTAAVMLLSGTEAAAQPIRVAANVLASRDGQSPKVEFHLAAHPRDPRVLLGAAIVFEPDATCRIYTSRDGGWTWQSRDFAELRDQGCTDPQVAFGGAGTAYFVVMTFLRNERQQKRSAVSVYRSDDGGVSWGAPVHVGISENPDHPQLAVHARVGRPDLVYFSVNDAEGVALYRSEDGGQTFAPRSRVAARNGRAVFNINLVVLSDGTIVAPYGDAEVSDPAKLTERKLAVAMSADAGRSFSVHRTVVEQRRSPSNPISLRSLPEAFAADTGSPRYRDRLYCVWMDFGTGRARLLYSVSTDRGETWQSGRPVDVSVPASDQFRPAVTVAPNGTVGVSWFDNRDGEDVYAQYFAASTDGGESFIPAVRVSSTLSPVAAPGNALVRPSPNSPTMTAQDSHFFILDSVRATFPDGGDYLGLAADADNVFHPFWPDARTGSFQVWTARVVVGQSEDTPAIVMTADAMNRALRPVFDPISDGAQGVWDIPIRIRNISNSPVCGPVFAVVTGSFGDAEAPSIINAANGAPWAGAAFDYSRALGDFACLESGGVSNAISWRVRPVQRHRESRIPTFIQIRFSPTPTLPQ